MSLTVNHIEHAIHNESVCKFLSKKETFGDWIITTAFYSALHFIRHIILPYNDTSGKVILCFEEFFKKLRYEDEGRHGFQNRYVSQNFNSISVAYKQLHDLSNNARYFEYNYPRETANEAKDLLSEIKQFVKTQKDF